MTISSLPDLEPGLGKTPKEGKYYGLDDPKFSTRGEPDPEQTFMVNIRGGRFETKTLMLEVTEDGIIAKAEAESKNEAIDFVTAGLKTAVSIAAPIIPFAGLPITADANPNPKADQIEGRNANSACGQYCRQPRGFFTKD